MKPIVLNAPATCHPVAGVTACGLPSREDLEEAKSQGARTILNLCAPGEVPFDEQRTAEALGLRYYALPIRGPADFTKANATRFSEIVGTATNHPIVVHCASGNRAGALFALKAFFVDGDTIEDSLEKGRAAGLTSMATAVRSVMERV